MDKEYPVRKATNADVPSIARMSCAIWHSSTLEELSADFSRMIDFPENAVFVVFSAAEPAGFAQCGLRHDYVEGTMSSPVGYLEGIYVDPNFRRQGLAKLLLTACENWARNLGCTEFASDCELNNSDSLNFHLGLGFSEANRIICFTKKL